jgi:hypothetical protein
MLRRRTDQRKLLCAGPVLSLSVSPLPLLSCNAAAASELHVPGGAGRSLMTPHMKVPCLILRLDLPERGTCSSLLESWQCGNLDVGISADSAGGAPAR